MEIDVLYLDNHLLVVNKAAGVLVQGDRSGDLDLLTASKAWLKTHFNKPGNVFLGLVHRLDRPVSGVVAFARTSKSAARLSDQFRRRTPEKEYVTIVEGGLEGGGELVDYVVKENEEVRVVSPERAGAKRAVLRYSVLHVGSDQTLLRIRLQTGRPHQIRVQLAHLGHPIVGDSRYGSTRSFEGRNLALHSFRLSLDHPTRKERVSWSAPTPPVWDTILGDNVQHLLATK